MELFGAWGAAALLTEVDQIDADLKYFTKQFVFVLLSFY